MRIVYACLAGSVITAAVAWSPPLAAQSAASCDRVCLAGVMTAYLDSLVAHDASKAPLAADARFTEDAKQLPVGEGLWKTATKLRPFRTDFLDPATGTAAVHAVLEESGTPVLLAARLRVVDRRITEVETIVVRSQQEGALFQPDALTQASAGHGDRAAGRSAHVARRADRNGASLSRRPESRQLRDIRRAVRAGRVPARERRAHGGARLHVPAAELREHARSTASDAGRNRRPRRRRRRRERHGALMDGLRAGLVARARRTPRRGRS